MVQHRIQIREHHHGSVVTGSKRGKRIQRPGEIDALLDRLEGRALDGRPVRQRIAERDAQLDHVRTFFDKHCQHVRGERG